MGEQMIVDRTVLERVITGFHEEEFYFEGFETQSVERQPNLLTWVVERKIHEKQFIAGADGKLGDDIAVHIYLNYKVEEDDSLNLTYKLTWWYSGGDDDLVRLPSPTPGAVLCLEVIAA